MTQQDQGQAAVAVEGTLSPSAPGLPPESLAPIDLTQVAPPGFPSTRWLLVVGTCSALAFASLTVAVARHAGPVSAADLQIHFWVLTNRDSSSLSIARVLTWGGATVLTLPALVVIGALVSPRRRAFRSRIGSGVLLAGVAALGMYLGLLVNAVVGGVRPLASDWAGAAGGPSFPSGHTTAATIFAASVVWALAHRAHTRAARIALGFGAVAYAVGVGLTRAWLGVHWPSDVVGGWLFGIAWGALAAASVIMLRRNRSRRS